MSNIPVLISDRRNYTFVDGVSVAMFVFAMSVLNLVLTMLETWISSSVGYGLLFAILFLTWQFFSWKSQLDDDTFTDSVDWYAQDAVVFAIGLFIVSEIFIFFGFFWVVVYSSLVDFTLDSWLTGIIT